MSCKDDIMDDSSVMYPSSAMPYTCVLMNKGPACAIQSLHAKLLWGGLMELVLSCRGVCSICGCCVVLLHSQHVRLLGIRKQRQGVICVSAKLADHSCVEPDWYPCQQSTCIYQLWKTDASIRQRIIAFYASEHLPVTCVYKQLQYLLLRLS